MQADQQGHPARSGIFPRFFPTAKWIVPCLALGWLLCAAMPAAARQASDGGLEKPAPAAKKAPATEARLPGDEIAKGIISRAKPSEKDNSAALIPLIGTWDYVESFWTDPKAKPQPATGFVTNEMVLDQRYLSSKAAGTLNIGREQIPVEGQELIGFDTARKSFSFTAADTLTTAMTAGSGTFDEKARIIRETGRFTHPLTGAQQGFRSEIKFIDDTHYKRTVFAVDKSGKETKLTETDYTRR